MLYRISRNLLPRLIFHTIVLYLFYPFLDIVGCQNSLTLIITAAKRPSIRISIRISLRMASEQKICTHAIQTNTSMWINYVDRYDTETDDTAYCEHKNPLKTDENHDLK